MSDGPDEGVERILRRLAVSDPREIREFLANFNVGRPDTVSAPTPTRPRGRRRDGLWVPNAEITERAPIDFARSFISWSNITDGERHNLSVVQALLAQVPLKNILTTVAEIMATLRAPGIDATLTVDRSAIGIFIEPYRSRLSERLAGGSLIHAPQLLMVLAKLALAWCPDSVPANEVNRVPVVHLLLIIADNIDFTASEELSQVDGADLDELLLDLAANTNFNASFPEESGMALYSRRWSEMARETPSKYFAGALDDEFVQAVGFDLHDQCAVASALWTSSCISKKPVVHIGSYFGQTAWDQARLEKILNHIALPVEKYREQVAKEIEGRRLAWYFTTFSWYPIVRFDDFLVVLDPKLLMRRCLSRMPLMDLQDALQEAGRSDQKELVTGAFNEYSERYAIELLESLADSRGAKRVYRESDLLRAYGGSKIADVVVDYGDAWVVVEVSTTEASRDTINAVSLDGPKADRKKIVREATQASETIVSIRRDEAALTGSVRANPVRFFPVVVLTEGFPNNPLVMSRIRDDLTNRGILAEADTAPLEILDLTELDMVEGLSETTRQTFLEVLRQKEQSNFRNDSVRNFLVSDNRFRPLRPARVTASFSAFLDRAIEILGLVPESSEEDSSRDDL